MKSFTGAVKAPIEVIHQKYVQFFETIAAESTSESYVYLAALIDRLTQPQVATLQNNIQRKIAYAEKLDPHLGIVLFVWNVLKKHPKLFNHNQIALLTICKNALNDGFVQIYVNHSESYSPEPVFVLFATYFNTLLNDIIDTTDILRSNPPYKEKNMFLLPIMNKYGRDLHSPLLCYFLDLVKSMIGHVERGNTIPIEKLIKLITGCLHHSDEMVHTHALAILTQIASLCKNYYFIASNAIFNVLKNFTISPNVLIQFLLDLNSEIGALVDIHRFFPHLITNFADGLKVDDEIKAANELVLLDRPECANVIKKIGDKCKKDIPDYDLYADLIATIIESNPSSLPIEPLMKIQQCICHKILASNKPETVDLRILNALLAVTNEKMPSPCQVARTIYSWSSIRQDDELSQYAFIGRALCDAQRSSRFLSYPHLEPDVVAFNSSTVNLNEVQKNELSKEYSSITAAMQESINQTSITNSTSDESVRPPTPEVTEVMITEKTTVKKTTTTIVSKDKSLEEVTNKKDNLIVEKKEPESPPKTVSKSGPTPTKLQENNDKDDSDDSMEIEFIKEVIQTNKRPATNRTSEHSPIKKTAAAENKKTVNFEEMLNDFQV